MAGIFPCLVVGFVSGLAAGSRFVLPEWTWVIPLLFAATIFLARNRLDSGSRRFALIVLFVCLGAVHSQRIIPKSLPANHVVHHIGDRFVGLEGELIGYPEIREDKTRLLLRADRVFPDGRPQKASGRVLVNLYKGGDHFFYGDRIRIRCDLHEPISQGNPGAFDWKQYLALRKIYVTAYISDENAIVPVRRADERRLGVRIAKVRKKLSDHIRTSYPKPASDILRALILGERWAVPGAFRDAFSALGVSHLLAISGLHMGIIAFFCYGIFRRILLRFETIALRFPVEKIAWGATIPVLAVYAEIAGMGLSTQRALIMIAAYAVSVLFDRSRNLYHTLALAAFVILLIHPESIFDISFQLSFISVLGLIYAVPKLDAFLGFGKKDDPADPAGAVTKRGFSNYAFMMILSTVAAILSTLPVTVLHFHQVAVGAVFANLVLVPLIGMAVLPAALGGAFAYLVWPPLGGLILGVCAWIVQWTALGVERVARQIGDLLYLPSPTPFEVAIYYGICVGICHLRKRWVRFATAGMVVLLVGSWAGESIMKRFDDRLRVRCLSVGNGLSILVQGPGGRWMLVDGGGDYKDRADIGALQVAPVLWHYRLTAPDRVVLSHPDADHMNGLRFILKAFRVRSLWDNGDRPDTEGYALFEECYTRRGIRPEALYRGMHWTLGDARVSVLHPPERGFYGVGDDPHSQTNNASVVLRIEFGDISFLFPGDIEAEAEDALSALGGLQSTVLIAPHHGSRTSNTERFLDAVSPKYVVVCARGGETTWLSREVLDRYRSRSVQVFHTGLDGMVSFSTDGKNLEVETFLEKKE